LDSLFLVQPITERIKNSSAIRFISMDSTAKIITKMQISQSVKGVKKIIL
jgi:hypothetical protein